MEDPSCCIPLFLLLVSLSTCVYLCSYVQMDDNPLIYVRELTWLKPKKIIPHWRENKKVLTRAADQVSEDACIPHALIEGKESKLRVQPFWSNERAPRRLSVQQLIDVGNNSKNPKHRTTNRLLDWIMKHGVVAATDYDARNHRAVPVGSSGFAFISLKQGLGFEFCALRKPVMEELYLLLSQQQLDSSEMENRRPKKYIYIIKFLLQHARQDKITGWEHVDVNEDFYIQKMKHLLTSSPIIGEFPLYNTYDKTGQEQLLQRAEAEAITDGSIQSGHVVLFTGWGYKSDNTLFWEHPNSYGVWFGRDGGFAEIVHNKFHWVYAIKHVQGKDPSPNRASRS